MSCPRCQQPLAEGNTCPVCAAAGESLFGPVPPPSAGFYRRASPPLAPPPEPAEPAWLRDATRPERKALPANLLVGGATLFVGLGLTSMSYVGVFGRTGGHYTVYVGLIAFGGYRLFRGLIMRD